MSFHNLILAFIKLLAEMIVFLNNKKNQYI